MHDGWTVKDVILWEKRKLTVKLNLKDPDVTAARNRGTQTFPSETKKTTGLPIEAR